MLRAIGPRRRHPSEKAAGPKASKVYRRYRPKAYGGLAAVGEAPSGLQGRGKWKAWAPELGWVVGQMVRLMISMWSGCQLLCQTSRPPLCGQPLAWSVKFESKGTRSATNMRRTFKCQIAWPPSGSAGSYNVACAFSVLAAPCRQCG